MGASDKVSESRGLAIGYLLTLRCYSWVLMAVTFVVSIITLAVIRFLGLGFIRGSLCKVFMETDVRCNFCHVEVTQLG